MSDSEQSNTTIVESNQSEPIIDEPEQPTMEELQEAQPTAPDHTYHIAVIRPNPDTGNLKSLSLLDSVDQHCFLEEVQHGTVVENIAKHIGMTAGKIRGDTNQCYQDYEYVYDICFVDPESNHMEADDSQINYIASHICLRNTKLYGAAVIMRSRINDDRLCEAVDISIDDVKKLLRQRIIHQGLILKADGKLCQLSFNHDPLEGISKDEIADYGCIEAPLLKFNLVAYFKVRNYDDRINKNATRLINRRVYGDVIIVSRCTEELYDDFTEELYRELDRVCWGRLSNRRMTDKDNEDKKISGLPVINNKYVQLRDRLSVTIDDRGCVYCCASKKPGMTRIVCTGCYRVYYKSNECRVADWTEHKKECLNNRPSVNEVLLEQLKKPRPETEEGKPIFIKPKEY